MVARYLGLYIEVDVLTLVEYLWLHQVNNRRVNVEENRKALRGVTMAEIVKHIRTKVPFTFTSGEALYAYLNRSLVRREDNPQHIANYHTMLKERSAFGVLAAWYAWAYSNKRPFALYNLPLIFMQLHEAEEEAAYYRFLLDATNYDTLVWNARQFGIMPAAGSVLLFLINDIHVYEPMFIRRGNLPSPLELVAGKKLDSISRDLLVQYSDLELYSNLGIYPLTRNRAVALASLGRINSAMLKDEPRWSFYYLGCNNINSYDASNTKVWNQVD